MAGFKGNFHSGAYNPSYNVEKATGLMKSHKVTAAEVTATKVGLDMTGVAGDKSTAIVIATIYRAGVALPSEYTLTITGGIAYISGNANYTLTANDVIVYMIAQNA